MGGDRHRERRVNVGRIKSIHPHGDRHVRRDVGRKRGRSPSRVDHVVSHPQTRRIRLTEPEFEQGVEMALADGSFRQNPFLPSEGNGQWTETFHLGSPQQGRDWRYQNGWHTQQFRGNGLGPARSPAKNHADGRRKQIYQVHPHQGTHFLPHVGFQNGIPVHPNARNQDVQITESRVEQGVEVELRNEKEVELRNERNSLRFGSFREIIRLQHSSKWNKRKICFIGLPLLIILATGLALTLMFTVFEVDLRSISSSNNNTNIAPSRAPKSTPMPSQGRTSGPTKLPTNRPTRGLTRGEEISSHILIELEEANIYESSYAQKQTLDWMINIDNERIDHDERGFIEKFALVTAYFALHGKNWENNDSWLSDPEICTWFGIECDFRGSLRSISLEHNKLKGTIPPEITFLSDLTSLKFGGNSITGLIPNQIGSMSNLLSLSLQSNSLTGAIPRNIYDLKQLSELNLASNNLNGNIKGEIGNMIALTSLNLASNGFSKRIPYEIGSLQSLEKLFLNDNNFSGSIPKLMRNLQKLTILVLKGTIPYDIGSIQGMKKLQVQNNMLTGSIPTSLFINMTFLEDFRCHGNNLSGSIDSAIANLQDLTMFSVHENSITGTLPEEIGKLVNLKWLHLNHNVIKGTIPDEIEDLRKLEILDLSENKLTGTIPITGGMPSLEILSLWDNELTGEIPANITSSGHMTHLYLDGNNLSGRVPCDQEGEISIHADCAGDPPKVMCRKGCCEKCYY